MGSINKCFPVVSRSNDNVTEYCLSYKTMDEVIWVK